MPHAHLIIPTFSNADARCALWFPDITRQGRECGILAVPKAATSHLSQPSNWLA